MVMGNSVGLQGPRDPKFTMLNSLQFSSRQFLPVQLTSARTGYSEDGCRGPVYMARTAGSA